MAQDLPTIHLSAITIMHIRPYSGGVPLTIDDEALALIKVTDRDRNPLHLSYATPINNEYYEVIIDLTDHSDTAYVGQGYMELMIDDKVMLSDKCVIGSTLFPSNEQPPSPYGTIVNVTDGSITLSTTPTLYQLSPIPSDQTELNLTFTPSNTDNIHKLLFHSEAPSLVINVDGASISGHYTGPGWYCAMIEEIDSVITINLERLTDFTTESVYTVKGFNTILVEDEWPTYGRRDTLYIHTLTREARIWKNEDWWPVGSSEYKYAPKSETDPLPMGLVAVKGIEEQYAAGDHVHPFSIELTTNHLDTNFTTPTDTHVPSSKLVKDTIDQVKSDLEDEISSLSGGVDVTALNGKVDKVEGKGLSTNDLTDELLETLEGSEQKYNKDLNFDTPTNGRYPSTLAVSTALGTKVDKVTGKSLSTNDLTNERLSVLSGSEQKANKATTLDSPDNIKYPSTLAVSTALDGKVDKVEGKGLSDNNYTTEEKNKLASAITSLPTATTIAPGIVELATSAEVTQGSDSSRVVVPSTLKVELDKKVDKVEGKGLSTNDLTNELVTTINGKVDKVEGKGLSTNDLTNELVITINGSEQTSNKATTLDSPDNTKYPTTLVVSNGLNTKVDKVEGKGLSTNDLTDELVTTINGKVDKVEGKGLSTNDLTNELVATINSKVDKVEGKDLSTNDLTDDLVTTINGSEQTSNKATTLASPDNTKYPSALAVSTALDGKVDKVDGKGLSTNDLTDELVATINTKVDKVEGKGLSTNDYTTEEKNKLATALTSLPDASPTAKGVIELATSEEVTTGEDSTRAVVPSTLKTELDKKVDKVEGKDLSTNDLTDERLSVLGGAEQASNKATTLANPDNTKYPTTSAVSTALDGKVDKVEGKGLSTNDLTNDLVTTINGSEQTSNKATTLSTPDDIKYPSTLAVSTALSTKVDKVEGKGLSDNNYTTAEKNKLASAITALPSATTTTPGVIELATSEEVTVGEDATRAVVPSTLKTELDKKVDKVTGKGLSTNDLTNDLVTTINGSEQTSNKATTLSTPDDIKYPSTLAVSTALNGKVDKVTGKGLSTNDYTTAEKNKLASALTSLPNATTEAKGIIELATEAEVTAGTLTDRAVVPSTLKVELDKKVDKVSGYGLSKNDLSDARLITLNGSEQTSNKATTLASPDNTKYPTTSAVSTALDGKVDKVEGKGLSTNDLTDELVTTINGKVDKVEGKSLSDNNYTTEEKSKVATIQNETLTTINGTTAEIEPWSRSRWTITGDCSLTLSDDWSATGKEHAYILITLKTGATLSVPSTVVFDDYLDQGEGVYEVELINLDGVIHFRWTECYPIASIKFYVTTTAPNQTYTINALGVSASTDVGWGDGSLNTYTGETSRTHVYAAPGTYEVRILPAENIVLLNLQGELVSEVNSVDLKAASNMKYFYLRDLSNAIGTINTIDMVDWPLTRYFYLYNSPLLTFYVNSVHMKGWNPSVFYLHKLINGNTTINTEDMAGWTNIENIILQQLPTLGGSLDTLDWAGWSNLRSVTLYILPTAFNVRFHTEDLINMPIAALHLYHYDGRNTVINTADLATKTITYFRLYKLPLSVVTVNSADMTLWNTSYLMITDLAQTTGVIDMSDLAGQNLTSFGFIDCPLITFIVDQRAFLSWTGLLLLQISNCTFTTQQMDETLYYLYTAAPTRTVTGGTISFGGTSSSSPSGVYEAPDCPVTSNTPGRGIAYALKNDSCSVGFNKWATVTIK